jgi:LacI family transcriptional regulator
VVVTSHDVARLAGVSQPTVSRALRNSSKVSAKTKERVRQAALALGYVPSDTGRALSSGRTHRVGLLLTDLENQFYPHIIAPIHHELQSLGYQLVLQTESSDLGQVTERLIANSVDGVVLATTTIDSAVPLRLRDRGVPFVYFNRTAETVDADSATVDADAGLREAARRVVDFGHRLIGAIYGPRNTSTAQHREGALRDALEDDGLVIPGRLTYRGPFDFDTGFQGAQHLLRSSPPPTVIVCSNDVVAFGALNAARQMDLAVPDDVSIIGFDDLPPAAWPLIQLTTVAFDLDAMARRAARLLVTRIADGDVTPPRHDVFPTRLVLRRTLAAAP